MHWILCTFFGTIVIFISTSCWQWLRWKSGLVVYSNHSSFLKINQTLGNNFEHIFHTKRIHTHPLHWLTRSCYESKRISCHFHLEVFNMDMSVEWKETTSCMETSEWEFVVIRYSHTEITTMHFKYKRYCIQRHLYSKLMYHWIFKQILWIECGFTLLLKCNQLYGDNSYIVKYDYRCVKTHWCFTIFTRNIRENVIFVCVLVIHISYIIYLFCCWWKFCCVW